LQADGLDQIGNAVAAQFLRVIFSQVGPEVALDEIGIRAQVSQGYIVEDASGLTFIDDLEIIG